MVELMDGYTKRRKKRFYSGWVTGWTRKKSENVANVCLQVAQLQGMLSHAASPRCAECGWSRHWYTQPLHVCVIARAFSASHRLPRPPRAWFSPMWRGDWRRLCCTQTHIHHPPYLSPEKVSSSQVYDSWRILDVRSAAWTFCWQTLF